MSARMRSRTYRLVEARIGEKAEEAGEMRVPVGDEGALGPVGWACLPEPGVRKCAWREGLHADVRCALW